MSLPSAEASVKPIEVSAVRAAWQKGLSEETGFWQRWVESKGSRWQENYLQRLDPARPLHEYVRSHLQAPPGATVRILDVGAGPLTTMGKVWPDRTVKVTAVDPLADDYNDMLDRAGIIPIVRTRRGEAETLTSLLPQDSFDLSHAINCLDHCYDPITAIREMIKVTRPGCYVLLEHAPNEAETQRYQGLHQWNFCVEGERFIIWRPGSRFDVADLVRDLGEVKATALPDWVRIEIRKHDAR